MKPSSWILGLALAAAAAGCNRSKDDALQNDLNLAAQQQTARTDSLSALERGYTSSTGAAGAGVAAPAASRTSSAPRTTTRRSASSSSGSGAATSASTSRPASTTTV